MSKTQTLVIGIVNECQSTPSSVIKFKAGFKLLCSISFLNLQSQQSLILLLHITTQTLTKCIQVHSCHPAWPIFYIVSWRGQAALLFATVWFCRTSCCRAAKDKHRDMNRLCSHQGRANLKADDNSSVKPVSCQHTTATASKHRASENTCPIPRLC